MLNAAHKSLPNVAAQLCGRVDLTLRDVAGCPNTRGYICPGETVQYECGNDMSTTTVWDEDGDALLFDCTMVNNRILLTHEFYDAFGSESVMCGGVNGEIFSNVSGCYRSRVTFESTTMLNGTMIHCGSITTQIGEAQEVVIVGKPHVTCVSVLIWFHNST